MCVYDFEPIHEHVCVQNTVYACGWVMGNSMTFFIFYFLFFNCTALFDLATPAYLYTIL